MRQEEFKSIVLKALCVFGGVFIVVLAGCRDNPEDKAAKNVHQEIQQAIAQNDPVAAQQQVESAIATHRPSGLAQESASWVNGSLMLQQGLARQSELPVKTAPIDKAIEAIALQLVQSEQWLFEKERIESMLALQDREIAELSGWLAGTPDSPGLQTRLAEAQAALSTLESQRQSMQAEHDAVLALLAKRQSQADDLLRQAELAQGDQRLSLRQQAYDLLLGGKDDYVKAQSLENQLGNLDGQIALSQTHVQSLGDNVEQTQIKIDSLETDQARPLLKSQLAEIDQMLTERRQQIYAQADAIKAGLADYLQATQEIGELFENAADQFQRVRSADAGFAAAFRQADSLTYAGFAAAFRQADSLTYAGVTLGEKMNTLRRAALRLSGIVGSADETLARGLAERLPMSAELNPQELEKFNALFTAADEAYQDAGSRARRIPKVGQDTACTVLKSHILSVHAKMTLADALKQFDLANQTQTRLEELKKEGDEYGDAFKLSTTARLLDKGLDFVPSLPVNVELYFEGIRQRFGEWKTLQTPQQQAEIVERNLAEMEELVKKYGDEMAKLLEPIKQEMLTAKEQGFVAPKPAEPETPAASTEQQNGPMPEEMMPFGMPGGPMPEPQQPQ